MSMAGASVLEYTLSVYAEILTKWAEVRHGRSRGQEWAILAQVVRHFADLS
jgi:hypothetical protein